MTPDEIKSAITGWSNQGTALQLVEDRSEPGADFVLGLRTASRGAAGTVPVEVRLDQGADRVTVTSTSTSSAAPDEIRSLLDSRPASVSGDTSGAGTVITSHVYTDGFTKHALVRAVAEVAKTRALVDGLAGASAAAGAGAYTDAYSRTSLPTGGDLGQGFPTATPATETAQAAPSWSAQPAQPLPSSLPTPSFSPAPTPSATPGGYAPLTGQPAPQSQPASAAFAPTHTVPPQGMQAWAAPDPNGAVVATLGGGLPIQITEVRGAWAHVLCSNGWTGWVDGRIIGVAR
jgi:Bacterial SH3 domain